MGALAAAAIIIVVLTFVLRHMSRDAQANKLAKASTAQAAPKRGGAPDHPPSFEDQIQWIVVRSNSTAQVASRLGLLEAEPTNWEHGVAWGRHYGPAVEGVAQTPCYVSTAMEGWVFVMIARPLITRREIESILAPLSDKFGDAQSFVRLPGEESLYGWDRAEGGVVVRSFRKTKHGTRSFGKPSEAEHELLSRDHLSGHRTSSPADQSLSAAVFARAQHAPLETWPERPLKLAEQWSLDPTQWPKPDVEPEWLGLAGFVKMEANPAAWLNVQSAR